MEPGQTQSEVSSKFRGALSSRKKIIFAAVPSIALAILVFIVWLAIVPKRGSALCRYAWQRTYTDRNQPVPTIGPREGDVTGNRVFQKPGHPATKWCEPLVDLPGILEIDADGRQHYRPGSPATFDMLIIGGSVAAGTFATTSKQTYFGRVGAQLEAEKSPASITVFAGGAWKSGQDLAALKYTIQSGLKPNLVVLLNGLNDLTNGASTDALYGQRVPTRDGSAWTPVYHEHDYARRTAVYLRNMQSAATFCREHNMAVLFVLQPALFERDPLTDVERQLLKASLAPHKSMEVLIDCYAKMGTGLSRLADEKEVFFLDCSRIFNKESATTFADMWHFSDFGHQILANELTSRIIQVLDTLSKANSDAT